MYLRFEITQIYESLIHLPVGLNSVAIFVYVLFGGRCANRKV